MNHTFAGGSSLSHSSNVRCQYCSTNGTQADLDRALAAIQRVRELAKYFDSEQYNAPIAHGVVGERIRRALDGEQ